MSIVGFLLILGSVAAEADVTLSFSPTAPSVNGVANYMPSSYGGYQWRDNESSRRDIGQSFRAPNNMVMDSFSLRAGGNIQAGASGADFTLKVYENSTDASLGTLFSTQTGVYLTSSVNPVSGGWVTFDIQDLSLVAGNWYTVVLVWDNADIQDQDQVFASTQNEDFTSGRRWESSDGTTFVSSTGYDLSFSVQRVPVEMTLGAQPTHQVLESFSSASYSGYQWRDNESSRRDLGQSFQASCNSTMDSFSLLLNGNVQAGASSAAYTLTIFESTNEVSIGTAVFTQSGSFLSSSVNPASGNWVTFDAEDTRLTEDNWYTMMLSWDHSAVQDQDQVFASVSGGMYANGRRWESSDGVTYSSTTGYDLVFSVQHAAVEVSSRATQPDEKVLAAYFASSHSGYQWRDNESSRRDLGQSFQTPYDSWMDSFSLLADGNIQAGASGAPFEIKIFESTNLTSIGTLISTQSGVYADSALNPVNDAWLIFDLEDQFLTAGHYYTVMLSWETGAVQDQDQVFALAANSTFVAGRKWESSDGATYSSTSGYDLCFSVQMAGSAYDPAAVLNSLDPAQTSITIPAGVYRLPATGLSLGGLTNLTVEADGVTFLGTDFSTSALELTRCSNVTIRGLSIDYDPLPFTQGILTSIDSVNRTADFTVHDGYPDFAGSYVMTRFHLFDDGDWKPGAPDYYAESVQSLNARQGRITLRSTDSGFSSLEVGDEVVFNIRSVSAVSIGEGCSGVDFEDVNIYAAPGGAIKIRFAEDAGTFTNVRVVPGPVPAGAVEARLMSSCADGFNAAYTRAGPVLDGCEFAYMGDDGLNLHGVTMPVLMWEDDRTFVAMRPYLNPFHELLRAGDEIRFLSAPDYALVEAADISSITRANEPSGDWLSLMQAAYSNFEQGDTADFYRVVLDQDVYSTTNALSGTNTVFVESFASTCAGYEIRNSYFHDHRARGLRLMAGSGLIESNVFERIKGAAISVGPEFAHWREAGWVEDVIIADNEILDVGQGTDMQLPASYTLGAISVFARVDPNGSQTQYYAGNSNVDIVNNSIDGCSLDGIHVVATQNGLVESNTISQVNLISVPTAGSTYGLSSGQPITVQHSGSVVVRDNEID